MKLTNRQIISSAPSFGDLLNLKLPVKTSFRIAKVVKLIQSALDDYNETLDKIKGNYAEKDDDGKFKVVDENQLVIENFGEFQADVNELLDIENDLEIKKIRLKDFGNIVVEPSVFLAIDWFIEE